MQPIAEWLEKLGLGQYAQRFAENGIDLSDLRHLTDQDLKDIGVLLGHRRRMLAAIAELAGAVPATVPKRATHAGLPLQVRIGIATGLVVVGDLIGAKTSRGQTCR